MFVIGTIANVQKSIDIVSQQQKLYVRFSKLDKDKKRLIVKQYNIIDFEM